MSDDKFIVPSASPVVPGRFDTRVINKSLKNGEIREDEVKAHMDQLPDESEWAEYVDFSEIVGDEDIETIQDIPENQSFSAPQDSHIPSESISDGGFGGQSFGGQPSSPGSTSSSGPLYGDGGIANSDDLNTPASPNEASSSFGAPIPAVSHESEEIVEKGDNESEGDSDGGGSSY